MNEVELFDWNYFLEPGTIDPSEIATQESAWRDEVDSPDIIKLPGLELVPSTFASSTPMVDCDDGIRLAGIFPPKSKSRKYAQVDWI